MLVVVEIGGDVEGDAVEGDPFFDPNPNGGDFSVFNPYADTGFMAGCGDVELGKYRDEDVFQ